MGFAEEISSAGEMKWRLNGGDRIERAVGKWHMTSVTFHELDRVAWTGMNLRLRPSDLPGVDVKSGKLHSLMPLVHVGDIPTETTPHVEYLHRIAHTSGIANQFC
jgi:hypothetical protein